MVQFLSNIVMNEKIILTNFKEYKPLHPELNEEVENLHLLQPCVMFCTYKLLTSMEERVSHNQSYCA